MKLSHNADEWHGTFGIALRYMVEDLLSDGQPFKAKIEQFDAKTVTGAVCEITRVSDQLTVDVTLPDSSGSTMYIDVDNVKSIEIL